LCESRREEICRFYDFFESQAWFTPEGRFAAEMLDVEPPADHMVGPLAVHLEVTDQCNLACSHCFAGRSPQELSTSAPLSLAKIDRLFGELAGIGSFRVGLTGGEPFLREDLLEIIDSALAHRLHPCLTTNGLLITDTLARQLARRAPLRLSVSLEGATAEANDAVRGRGTFEQVLHRLRHLRRHHVPFGLSFTLTRSNTDQVEQCAALARQCGAEVAVFRPLYPVGRAFDSLDRMPTYDQYADALKRLAVSAAEAGTLQSIDPFSPEIRGHTSARIYGGPGCGAGTLVASVSVDGHVSPCSFLGSMSGSGSLRDSTFSEIWHSDESFVRMRAKGAAGGFSGGCRARALALHGDIDATDPWYDEYLKRHTEAFLPQTVCEVTI
jgi:MoaA/NifB/PqqE/SkfB family radical SAM enzyme